MRKGTRASERNAPSFSPEPLPPPSDRELLRWRLGKAFTWLVFAASLVCVGLSAFLLTNYILESNAGKSEYQSLASLTAAPSIAPNPSNTPSPSAAPVEDTPALSPTPALKYTKAPVDMNALSKINSELVAWIDIKGTEIQYPVVQRVSDNQYYLSHTFEGKENIAGCLYLQSNVKADLSDDQSIIYGHNMRNGTMFHNLRNFRKQSFVDENSSVMLYLPDGSYREYTVAAVSLIEADPYLMTSSFPTPEEKQAYIDTMLSHSLVSCPAKPTVEDRFLSLMTCAYDAGYEDARLILFCVEKVD